MAVQHLVLLRGLVVVVAVSCELIQRDSADVEVGIPRVVRADNLIASRLRLEAAQAIVLDVVDALEKEEGDDPDRCGEQQPRRAEHQIHDEQIRRLDEVVPQHVVFH